MNRRSSCFFIRVPGAAATCGQSGCEHVPAAFGCWRFGFATAVSPARRVQSASPGRLFKDALAPPSPPIGQWERPRCSSSANGRAPPRNLARACQQQLRPSRDSPSPLRTRRPLAGLSGAAGRDSGGFPSAAGPALRDPRHRSQGPLAPRPPFSRHPATVAPRKPSPTLPSGLSLRGRRVRGRGAVLAAERRPALGALRAPLWEGREKKPQGLRETRSSDPCPTWGAGERV